MANDDSVTLDVLNRPTSGWTVDTVMAHFQILLRERDVRQAVQFEERDVRFQEALTDHSQALQAADKRYEQRFIAQEGAVQSALIAQEKAVNAALIAADRAVSKAELSSEKRFEAVNEFRGQLNDQSVTFLTRNEMNAMVSNRDRRSDDLSKEMDRRFTDSLTEEAHYRQKVDTDIRLLRESRSDGRAIDVTRSEYRQASQWVIGLWVIGGVSVVGLLLTIMGMVLRISGH